MFDEKPSPEDMQRFDQGDAFCPHCGGEVSDLADICPHCGLFMHGGATRRSPADQWFRQRWIILMVILLALLLSGLISFLAFLKP